MSKPRIGICGFGVVGRAIHAGFYTKAKFRIYDINPDVSVNDLEDVCIDSEFIFICVPTPMKENGEADTSIVEETVQRCLDYINHTDTILIIKSTIPPETTKMLQERHPDIHIVFSPEFLTARCARLDFINNARIILGGDIGDTKRVESLFRLRFPHTPIIHTDPTTAEIVKYAANCFFTTKLSYFNEIYQVCQKLGVDYEDVKKMVLLDGRIGNSHVDVPGFDGHLGWGQACFTKDHNALIKKEEELGIEPSVLKGVWKKNEEVRGKRYWKKGL